MTGSDWDADHVRCLGLGLAGVQIDETDAHGERILGESYLILLNAGPEPRPFRLLPRAQRLLWTCEFDTADPRVTGKVLGYLTEYPMQGRSVVVLRPKFAE
jgi:glycogen operon protein